MTFDDPRDGGDGRRPVLVRPRRRSRVLLPTLIILGVLIVLFALFAGFYTDLLWYRSVDYTSVFTTQLITKSILFVIFGLLLGGSVALNILLAYRSRPVYNAASPEQANLDRYRLGVDPFRRVVTIGLGLVLALLGGSSASGQWKAYLLWRNGTDFGKTDPQFNRDIGFFTFDLPFYRYVLGFAFATVFLSAIAALVTHYLYGGVRLQSQGDKTTSSARMHLSMLLGAFVLLKAVAYWLDRYSLATKDGRIGSADFTGLTYTDVNILLPAKAALAGIALVCALAFFANAFRRTWLLPGVAAGLLVLSAVLLGGIIPAVVQYFQVRPNEQAREVPYLERNIRETRTAFRIDQTEVGQLPTGAGTTGTGSTTAVSAPNVRLIDPAVVPETFRQTQQSKSYYSFPDTLDVDRYTVNGRTQDAIVAVRELDLGGVPRRNWINDHTIYTHGFGFVAARADQADSEGLPQYVESNIPPTGQLGEFEPRIYFGERSPQYSIVGSQDGAAPQEFDFAGTNGQVNYTYTGKGGAPVGSFFNRLMFAMRFQQGQILLSTKSVNENSKILYVREPRERVQKVAPWLTLDGNPYPAVINGRVLWIVDGYTTSGAYPYSRRTTLDDATADTLTTTRSALTRQTQASVNYIRNSVKATVDAYDGTVTLYAWDESDPVLRTWQKAFPDTVQPRSAISDGLLDHLRYPEDLFKVQRTLLAEYHVTDPGQFYTGQDFWRVSTDPANSSSLQPPYYLTVRLPGQTQAQSAFSLTTSYIPRANTTDQRQRTPLTAFAAVQANPDADDYGRIQLLRAPSNTTLAGPPQIYNDFRGSPIVATVERDLRSGGAEVDYGNLVTLPLEGGVLYVEPLYSRASSGTVSYPQLRKVIVGYRGKIAIADTYAEALRQVLNNVVTPPPTDNNPPDDQPNGGTATVSPALRQALADADRALTDAAAALRTGDFTKYGEAQRRLADAISRAQSLAAVRGASPSPSPSPSGTPAAPETPSPSEPTPAGSPTPVADVRPAPTPTAAVQALTNPR